MHATLRRRSASAARRMPTAAGHNDFPSTPPPPSESGLAEIGGSRRLARGPARKRRRPRRIEAHAPERARPSSQQEVKQQALSAHRRCSKTVPELPISAPERLAGQAEADVPPAVERLEILSRREKRGEKPLNSHAGGTQFDPGRTYIRVHFTITYAHRWRSRGPPMVVTVAKGRKERDSPFIAKV